MPNAKDIGKWVDTVRSRYENYLKASFYFKDQELRESFRSALQSDGELHKGPFPEPALEFLSGSNATDLADQCFPGKSRELKPALLNKILYAHQDRAIRAAYVDQRNVVVATGTGSGKTECFLYPILFELYRQHLSGNLSEPGVRALILYPMNALANDQRERLGDICRHLKEADSSFAPTFGQYIGQTPNNRRDTHRNAARREEDRLPGELIFREEMRDQPPHILLTNYSMLEYLLIRPEDSPLFDGDRSLHWQFIVLDEAHQYRGTKGMEMGMLVRRLKQRLREGGRQSEFRCIATSATLASGEGEEEKNAVSAFAQELFGETFSSSGAIFGEYKPQPAAANDTRRYHVFIRALEGAFLVHSSGKDEVVLNRRGIEDSNAEPLEIALCRECGQHYYVGRERNGKLMEAIRDPSQSDFGVDYYLPLENKDKDSQVLCRHCGWLSSATPRCGCQAAIYVKQCEPRKKHRDQLQKCEACGYQRGGIGDPVQEIVHGSDGPNAVIATALHELLPKDGRKALAFADNRQEAAFFAWYAEDSYKKLRDRNFMLHAITEHEVAAEGLSISDLQNRLAKKWESAGLFSGADTAEGRKRKVLTAILTEALTNERRLSLAGVGLAEWFIKLPDDFDIPPMMGNPPWSFSDGEARALLGYLFDTLRLRSAMTLPDDPATRDWGSVSPRAPQQSVSSSAPKGRRKIFQWHGQQSSVVKHFLSRLLADKGVPASARQQEAVKLMKQVFHTAQKHDRAVRNDSAKLLSRGNANGTFQLNNRWLRIKPARADEIWECKICASITSHNIRGICPRNKCPGNLISVDHKRLSENHYRILYERPNLPPALSAEEHTAQINNDTALERQEKFKSGQIHLLSSSTTFEIGVDLGDLEVVFLRNVPPEPFNYTQRVGRAGRRATPGFALTYCRRKPHDLYHYENPEERTISGKVQPPRLQMINEKIISRHMAATALSAFFKEGDNGARFKNVEAFIGDWQNPKAVDDLRRFCRDNHSLRKSLRQIVPVKMHEATGLNSQAWIDEIAGPDSRLNLAVIEVCSDYNNMKEFRHKRFDAGKDMDAARAGRRIKTIAGEQTLMLLSRKAVIPKYGFPVDVVELDTRRTITQNTGVSLQRDLSQAIAEYAPDSKVVANKKEWESYGIKTVAGKGLRTRHYSYTDALNFQQWDEGGDSSDASAKKYLIPEFGFVTPLNRAPREPQVKAQRLYTTRPFFKGFNDDVKPNAKRLHGVMATQAIPGTLVILCEGRERSGFYICLTCGRQMTNRKSKHDTPEGRSCSGTLRNFSLGHELITDVVRMEFEELTDQWDAYSLAYAILLGAAGTLDVPGTDLNITITGGSSGHGAAIVIYDNVPGGAGLVAQLIENERVFKRMMLNSLKRVKGECGCDSSCYGCLRSYRNQFAHPHLNRQTAMSYLKMHIDT